MAIKYTLTVSVPSGVHAGIANENDTVGGILERHSVADTYLITMVTDEDDMALELTNNIGDIMAYSPSALDIELQAAPAIKNAK